VISYKIENDAMDRTQTQDSLLSNIYFSLRIPRGSWFFNPAFGCRWNTIKKLTADGLSQAEDFAREALKWLLDLGRISSCDILAEQDNDNRNQCNVRLTVLKPDNTEITFMTFFMVV
jgi:phage gp46-like protein